MRCLYSGLVESCLSDKKKRILIGHHRDIFLDKILKLNMSTLYTQKLDANILMDYGDLEPPHLSIINVLRVMKYKTRKWRFNNDLNLCFMEPFLKTK